MLVKFTMIEKTPFSGKPSIAVIKEIYVNSRHIISVSVDSMPSIALTESVAKELGFSPQFSELMVSEGNLTKKITVIGSPTEVYQKIKRKQILKG